MPKGSKVHKMAKALMREGMSEGRAIATAQAKTGKSYATGRKPKRKRRK